MKPGQTIEDNGEKWICLRVAGGRAEIKRFEGEKPLHRKGTIQLLMKAWRKAKRGRVET